MSIRAVRSADISIVLSETEKKYSLYLREIQKIRFTFDGFIYPQGFWGSGEKGYLFSGSWGALLIIVGELGSKHILCGI